MRLRGSCGNNLALECPRYGRRRGGLLPEHQWFAPFEPGVIRWREWAAAVARAAAAAEAGYATLQAAPFEPGLQDAFEVAALNPEQPLDTSTADLKPIIADLQTTGTTTLAALAAQLTERGIPTARGSTTWTPMQVSRVMKQECLQN